MGRNSNRNRKQQRRKSLAASKRAPAQEDNDSEGEEAAENPLDKTLHFPATPKPSETTQASHAEDDTEPALSDGGILTSALSWASFLASNVKQVIVEVCIGYFMFSAVIETEHHCSKHLPLPCNINLTHL